ncbi:alanine racemase [Congregibacter brevis]|uniref:Alanine racemase n=1 Tax=Congregibacter brevis TaxID=3081201 RepID=A0ABZ0IAK1_9GAMM|nr:alanine racemase [Congregibacter sp. IMCC45268]
MARPTLARVFPQNIRHNLGLVRDKATAARVMACVKADAYGHGLVTVSQALHDVADGFAVACIEEALILRKHDITKPILMLEGPQSADEIAEASSQNLTLCINEWHQLEWLEQAGLNSPLSCWLKVDTGMHRLGFAPDVTAEAIERLLPQIKHSEFVVCTHFSSADLPEDNGISKQLDVFDRSVGEQGYAQSTANSAAIFRAPESHRDWVRPGYMLYGGSPIAESTADDLGLKPAMEFSAQVISIREVPTGERVGYCGRWQAQRPSRIATIAAGYGDGYPRHAPDGTPVFIDGASLPLAGRVSMDMITVDVTEHPGVKIGSKAVLWGDVPAVDALADHADSIGYELLAGMPKRVPRIVEP